MEKIGEYKITSNTPVDISNIDFHELIVKSNDIYASVLIPKIDLSLAVSYYQAGFYFTPSSNGSFTVQATSDNVTLRKHYYNGAILDSSSYSIFIVKILELP